ncbi:MAG: glycoside hydrolase family 57 protein [Bacteroidota bacterium]
MTSVCLYLKVHQPSRLKRYSPSDVDVIHAYEDADAIKQAADYASDNCYLPANAILQRLITRNKGSFRISFSISGITLELLQQYRPDVIRSFKKLTDTGCVEILGETYYHSLSYLHSKKEFARQVKKHAGLVKELFRTEVVALRNTGLIYNNDLAKLASSMGFKGLLCEGLERLLQGRSPNQLYAAPESGDFKLLLRNTSLSDDIAFRFGDPNWSEHPLTAEKFTGWLHSYPENEEVINLFLDYETFGIHKKADSGIFEFLDELPARVLTNSRFQFSTPADVLEEYYPKDIYSVPQIISWEDRSDVNCVWSINPMQNNTLKKIYAIENMVMNSSCKKSLDTWGRLQSADHFYYMSVCDTENETGRYHNPFRNANEAFQNYSNILVDFEISLIKDNLNQNRQQPGFRLPVYNLY